MKRAIRCGSVLVAVAISLTAACYARDDDCASERPRADPRPEWAISLKRVAAELRHCRPGGTCGNDLLTWFGMTYVSGYAVDPVEHDIILLGQTEPGAPALHLDDFVVALKNARRDYIVERDGKHYYSDPGVSIDPNPNVLRNLGSIAAVRQQTVAEMDAVADRWCAECEKPQNVRVEGIPFDTHFAQVMLEADYLMKRIADGSVRVSGIDSMPDAMLRLAIKAAGDQQAAPVPAAAMNRFWFYPGRETVVREPSAVRLVRSDVILLDEAQRLTRDGQVAGSGRSDPLARMFACQFSKKYADVAARPDLPIYSQLQSLFRWVELAREMVDRNAFASVGFADDDLFADSQVRRITVDRQKKGVARVMKWDGPTKQGLRSGTLYIRLPSCGGVSIAISQQSATVIDDGGEFTRIAAAAKAARTASAVWRFTYR